MAGCVVGIASAVSTASAPSAIGQCVRLGDLSRGAVLTHLPDAFAYIDAAVGSGDAVLVHCGDGDSEAGSTAIAVAWLMARESLRCRV